LGSLLAILALGLFSANVFVVRSASARLDQRLGFLVALLANVLFGALVLGVDLARRSEGLALHWGALGTFAVAGVLASYLGRRGFFRSVEDLGPSRASAIQVTSPMFAAVLAWLLIGEALDGIEVALIALVLCGLYLTILPASQQQAAVAPTAGRWTARSAGAVWVALFSAVAYAAGNVLRAQALDTWREPVLGGLVGAVAGTLAYAVWDLRRSDLRREEPLPAPGVLLWTLTGVLTISAQMAVIGATGYLPVAIVLAISSSLPLVVVPVSLLVLRNAEALRATTLLGTGLVLLGVLGILLR
jgi:drug/metabolite transporter (DMT)-like permease